MDSVIAPGADELLPKSADPTPEPIDEQIHEEVAITKLTEAPGWPLFVELLLKRCTDIETMTGVSLAGLDDAAIGRLYKHNRDVAAAIRGIFAEVGAIAQGVNHG